MLWRSKNDVDNPAGYSGSVLCTGSPAGHGEAVVFQNYETGLRTWEAEGSSFLANVKAKFLLPGEIRESVIVAELQETVGFNTVGDKSGIAQTEGHRCPSIP